MARLIARLPRSRAPCAPARAASRTARVARAPRFARAGVACTSTWRSRVGRLNVRDRSPPGAQNLPLRSAATSARKKSTSRRPQRERGGPTRRGLEAAVVRRALDLPPRRDESSSSPARRLRLDRLRARTTTWRRVVCADNGLADFGGEPRVPRGDGDDPASCGRAPSSRRRWSTTRRRRRSGRARSRRSMSATRSANDNLFTQMAKALENFKLPEMDFAAFGVGRWATACSERSRRA